MQKLIAVFAKYKLFSLYIFVFKAVSAFMCLEPVFRHTFIFFVGGKKANFVLITFFKRYLDLLGKKCSVSFLMYVLKE